MIVRFLRNNKVKYGWVVDQKVRVIEGDIFNRPEEETTVMTGLEVPLSEVQLLAPCQPSKIICIGLNYRDHAAEMALKLPKEPLIFMKPSTTLIGPGESIVYPSLSKNVHYEAELGVVIKKKAKHVSVEESEDVIMGYTCGIDVTARDLQFQDGQWTRGKSFDTFCPLGPGIVPKLKHNELPISLTVNGEIKQRSNTDQMIFTVPKLVAYISKVMTLLPGDVILTGTPPGVGSLQPGDQVAVTIEGIGTLSCDVVKE